MPAFQYYYFTLIRCSLLSIGVPLSRLITHYRLTYSSPIPRYSPPTVEPDNELSIRIVTSLLLGVVQQAASLVFLPNYTERVLDFFNPHDSKRTWQAMNDPPGGGPAPTRVGPDGIHRPPLEFGSFFSSAGNIIGEAGIPYNMELDAEAQRSISFFY